MLNSYVRKGEASLECIIFIVCVAIFLIVICSSVFYFHNLCVKNNQSEIIVKYSNLIKQMREDAKSAFKADIASFSSVTLFARRNYIDNASYKVEKPYILCRYELKDSNLLRYDKQNQASLLLENIESISFTSFKELPNLLTLRIYPKDKKENIFFTSFALRSIDKDDVRMENKENDRKK